LDGSASTSSTTKDGKLNPIKRMWRDLNDDVAWLHLADVARRQADVADLLQAYEVATLQFLTDRIILPQVFRQRFTRILLL
jgi:hypothetical protein